LGKFFLMVVLLSIASLPTSLLAETLIRQVIRHETLASGGETRETDADTTEIWLTETRVGSDSIPARQVVLLLAEEDDLILMFPRVEAYVVEPAVPPENSESPNAGVDSGGIQIPGTSLLETKVSSRNESRDINGWRCRRYNLTGRMSDESAIEVEIWASQHPVVDHQLLRRFLDALDVRKPGQAALVKARQGISGTIVRQVMDRKKGEFTYRTTTEIIACEEGAAPEGILAIPSGYEKAESTWEAMTQVRERAKAEGSGQ
jgi:hypothetical protein